MSAVPNSMKSADFHVADLSLADWGRKKGVQRKDAKYAKENPKRGEDVRAAGFPLHSDCNGRLPMKKREPVTQFSLHLSDL